MLVTQNIQKDGMLCLIQLQEAWMRAANFEKEDRKLVNKLVDLSRNFEVAVTNMTSERGKISWRLAEPLIQISDLLHKRNEANNSSNQTRFIRLPLDDSSAESKTIKDLLFANMRFPFHFRFMEEDKYSAVLDKHWGPVRRLPATHPFMTVLPRVTKSDKFESELSI